jgi:hypothetical protein
MCNRVLCLKYVDDNNTGRNLKDKILATLSKWNLDGKVKYIVSDSGANIKNAISLIPSM